MPDSEAASPVPGDLLCPLASLGVCLLSWHDYGVTSFLSHSPVIKYMPAVAIYLVFQSGRGQLINEVNVVASLHSVMLCACMFGGGGRLSGAVSPSGSTQFLSDGKDYICLGPHVHTRKEQLRRPEKQSRDQALGLRAASPSLCPTRSDPRALPVWSSTPSKTKTKILRCQGGVLSSFLQFEEK